MKASKALREARELIEDGRESYICIALEKIGSGDHDVVRARNHIEDLLFPNSSLGGWLRRTKTDLVKGHDLVDSPRMIATRLAWIDDMIRWHEARGD